MVKKSSSQPVESSEGPRLQLLEAAKKLFAKHGFDGTTVRALADEAGVNFALVNYYFESKDGLYRAVIKEFGLEKLAVAQRLLQSPNTLEEFRVRLRMFVEEMMVSHIEEPDLTKVVHQECESGAPRTPEIFKQTFMKVFETLVNFIQDSQKNGLIRDDLDSHLLTKIFFSGLMHSLRSDAVSKKYFNCSIEDPEYRQKLGDGLLEVFIQGAIK